MNFQTLDDLIQALEPGSVRKFKNLCYQTFLESRKDSVSTETILNLDKSTADQIEAALKIKQDIIFFVSNTRNEIITRLNNLENKFAACRKSRSYYDGRLFTLVIYAREKQDKELKVLLEKLHNSYGVVYSYVYGEELKRSICSYQSLLQLYITQGGTAKYDKKSPKNQSTAPLKKQTQMSSKIRQLKDMLESYERNYHSNKKAAAPFLQDAEDLYLDIKVLYGDDILYDVVNDFIHSFDDARISDNSLMDKGKETLRCLRLLMFELWQLDNDEIYFGLYYDALVHLCHILQLLNIRRKRTLEVFSPGISVSQIRFLCFSKEAPGNELAYEVFREIIACSSLEPQTKELYSICCGLAINLEDELISFCSSHIADKFASFREIEMKNSENVVASFEQIDGKDIYQLRMDKSDALSWEFSLCLGKKIFWAFSFTYTGKKVSDRLYFDANFKDQLGYNHIFTIMGADAKSIGNSLRKEYNVSSYEGTVIVGMYNPELFGGRIKERVLTFTDEVSLSVENGIIHFNVNDTTRPSYRFFSSGGDEKYERIDNICAIVGRNGTGKSTTFRMIGLDSPKSKETREDRASVARKDAAPAIPEKYILFYRIRDHYYYSSNMNEDEYQLEGISSSYRLGVGSRKNSSLIFYSAALTLNSEIKKSKINGTDISNGYIFKNEFDAHNVMRFWDFARKLQFLKDLTIPLFEEMLHFKPLICRFHFPSTMILGNHRTAVSLVNRYNKSVSEDYVEAEIPLWDENVSGCISIYQMLVQGITTSKGRTRIPEIDMEIPGLSSGQYALFDFYSRLHSYFLSQVPDKEKYQFNCFEDEAHVRNYILLLDEIELYMHPEWQKGFIEQLIHFLAWENATGPVRGIIDHIQIMLSSNSPFFMSDLPKGNICMLKEERDKDLVQCDTFAQNIHKILKDSFFMGDRLMGDFAYRKLQDAFDTLKTQENISEEKKQEIHFLMNQIGEPLLKSSMKTLYERAFPDTTDKHTLLRQHLQEILGHEISDEQLKLAMPFS